MDRSKKLLPVVTAFLAVYGIIVVTILVFISNQLTKRWYIRDGKCTRTNCNCSSTCNNDRYGSRNVT
ncbi:MAG: hypothetical protein RR601_05105, partial [Erysipelotrichales bacterium]